MDEDLLKQFHGILDRDEAVKETRDFKSGQELYSKWLDAALLQAFQGNPDNTQELKKTIALGFNNRGQMKYLAVDFDGAVSDYNKALEYDPALPCAFYNRGTILYRMGYFNQAYQDMSSAVKLSPQNDTFSYALGQCKLELLKEQGGTHHE